MRILVVEDDGPLAEFLRKGLEAESYAVDVASDGKYAEYLSSEHAYSLIVIDGSPNGDGDDDPLDLLRRIRAHQPALPIILLTAKGGSRDRLEGLNAGADDQLLKPFSYSELSARIRSVLRPDHHKIQGVLRLADLEIDSSARIVTRGARRIRLTRREFALLEYLMLNTGQGVSRAMIAEHVWNVGFDVYINYLRRKIDAGYDLKLIRTVRRVGYALDATPLATPAKFKSARV